jgi:hypothetical protein
MALQFTIPNNKQPRSAQTLASGFGLPLVQRALIGNIAQQPSDDSVESRFGTPIFDWIFIEKPTSVEYGYDEALNKYQATPVVYANNANVGKTLGFYCEGVIIEANLPRNIVLTQVSGYDKGSVVEYINNGDMNITIRGFVSTENADVYPMTDAAMLSSYCKAPVPLKITSTFINKVLDVEYIVVTGFNMFQNQGLRNVQYFEINCISNVPYTLTNNAQTAQ